MKNLLIYSLLMISSSAVIEMRAGWQPESALKTYQEVRDLFKKEYKNQPDFFKERFAAVVGDDRKSQKNGKILCDFIFNQNFPFTTKEDHDAYALAKSAALNMNKACFDKEAQLSAAGKKYIESRPEELSFEGIEKKLRAKIKTEDDLLNFKFELGAMVAVRKKIQEASKLK